MASGPEIGDGHRLLQRQRAGHDLAINGPQRSFVIGPGFMLADALQHRPFPVRRVDFLAGLELDLADLQDMPGALVQQLDDLRVEFVNGLAMFGNVHAVSSDVRRAGAGMVAPGTSKLRGCRRASPATSGWLRLSTACSASCSCSGGAVARPGSAVTSASGFMHRDPAQFIRRRQIFQAAQTKIFEKNGVVP